jgi:LuxR family maltose regulon positive regulatory protein
VVERWLASLPPEWYASHPILGLARVTYLVVTGSFDAGIRCLDGVERQLTSAASEETPTQLARVAAMRCAIACFQNDLAQAEMFADRALRELPEDELSWRADIYQALGETYGRHGRWDEAKDCYLKVLDYSHDPAARLRLAHVHGALADLSLRQGRLREAAASWHKALAAIEDGANWGRLPLPVIGWVYLRLGELHYEWNDLPTARDYLARGLEHAELGGDVRSRIAGDLLAVRIHLATGDLPAAGEALERVRPIVEQASFPEWTCRFERGEIDLWLAQDQVQTALAACAVSGERPEDDLVRLANARALLARGYPSDRAQALTALARLHSAAEATGRVGVQIEAAALQALAHGRGGDRVAAMTHLEPALRLAAAEGYVRLFLDLGLPFVRLLQEARARRVIANYVARLLAACGADFTAASPTAKLPEPLSAREREVLGLLAAGLTNREIAAAMTIAPETVKKHAAAIYGKLGVGRRTEAVARARALDLLE